MRGDLICLYKLDRRFRLQFFGTYLVWCEQPVLIRFQILTCSGNHQNRESWLPFCHHLQLLHDKHILMHRLNNTYKVYKNKLQYTSDHTQSNCFHYCCIWQMDCRCEKDCWVLPFNQIIRKRKYYQYIYLKHEFPDINFLSEGSEAALPAE